MTAKFDLEWLGDRVSNPLRERHRENSMLCIAMYRLLSIPVPKLCNF